MQVDQLFIIFNCLDDPNYVMYVVKYVDEMKTCKFRGLSGVGDLYFISSKFHLGTILKFLQLWGSNSVTCILSYLVCF